MGGPCDLPTHSEAENQGDVLPTPETEFEIILSRYVQASYGLASCVSFHLIPYNQLMRKLQFLSLSYRKEKEVWTG